MPYPSTLSTFTNPSPSDRLSTTPHSSIETAQNTGLSEIQAFVGTLSSTAGTLIYDIRAAASDGGGHVQVANKGGTGQTTYTKGDVLVASSSSVLTKLGIGTNNQVLTADSNQNAGVKWAGVANAIDIQNQAYTYARASIISGSVYGIVLSQAVSILSDGLTVDVKFPNSNTTSLIALQVNAQGPSSLTALIKRKNLLNLPTGTITPSMIGRLTFDSVSSVFQLTNSPLPVYTASVTTRVGNAASGDQTIAHGLGTVPGYVRISAAKTFGTNLATSRSDGVYDGVRTNCIEYHQNATQGSINISPSLIALITDSAIGTDAQKAAIAVDNTNITLGWELVGGPNAASIVILWEAKS